MANNVLVLAGDGIGPEVTAVAEQVLIAAAKLKKVNIEIAQADFGGAAIDNCGEPLPTQTLELAEKADAILLGAVGGPKWEGLSNARPEQGLLKLRESLACFANFRPALVFDELAATSTLKTEIVAGLDLLILRELTGGIYFGNPRGVQLDEENNQPYAFNTMVYHEHEIKRIAISAFEAALTRNKRVCSVDKANVLEVSAFWRKTVTEVAKDYPEVELSHMYVDNAAMQLIKEPKQFDVILTGNLFGDILSDAAAMLTGSIGMLPSASLNSQGQGIYEPVHGSAPDIAGLNKANPLAAILSVVMMCRYSLALPALGDFIENAVRHTLSQGYRTIDIAASADKVIGTAEIGEVIISNLSLAN